MSHCLLRALEVLVYLLVIYADSQFLENQVWGTHGVDFCQKNKAVPDHRSETVQRPRPA